LRNRDAAQVNVPLVNGLPSANSVADCPLRVHSSIRSTHIASVLGFMRAKMPTNHELRKNGLRAADTYVHATDADHREVPGQREAVG